MRCPDVNVLVYAHRPESPNHERWRDWLDEARRDTEPLGLISAVVSGFLRVTTHPRIFNEPTPIATAVAFIDSLVAAPAVQLTEPGPRHWELLANLCRDTGATGNRVPDAALVAVAIEHGATFVTADRGFARIPGLRVDHPI